MEALIISENIDTISEKSENKEINQKTNFFHLCVLIFVFGCFLGYVVEVIYSYFKHGHFINRQGMIYGPFNQVYGFGALIFTILLYRVRNCNKIVLFFAGAIIGGTFEYLCSLIQEILFKSISWNYSKYPLSFNGRTNPLHAMFWGVLGVLFFTFFLPAITSFINRIPVRLVSIASCILFIFMIFNMTISSAAVIRQTKRMKGDAPENFIECFLDKHYPDELLSNVYQKKKFIK